MKAVLHTDTTHVNRNIACPNMGYSLVYTVNVLKAMLPAMLFV